MASPKKKTIALIAHDRQKPALLEWARAHEAQLRQFELCATGTTGALLARELGLQVHLFRSGPLGGDQQVGAKLAEGSVHCVIFFWDPLHPQPHDVDVKALLRIAVVYDVPIACNPSTASLLMGAEGFLP